ncbi:hypothetical protein ACHAPJ_013408 [Fusarium lateritium]
MLLSCLVGVVALAADGFARPQDQNPNKNSNVGQWGPLINFPVVPAAGAIMPSDGRLLVWASGQRMNFMRGGSGTTWASSYDVETGNVTELEISNTDHNMFCPGISQDFEGNIIVTGGSSTKKTSLHRADDDSEGFLAGPEMNIPRGYQSQATISDGRTFVVGGSWSSVTFDQPGSGVTGNKNGELYDTEKDSWSLLPGVLAKSMLTRDREGVYRADNHMWLFGWKQNSVFQAGPSAKMHWISVDGKGRVRDAGPRANDPDSMCGVAVMYDAVAGKILTAGGAQHYNEADASRNAHVLTLGDSFNPVAAKATSPMAYAREFLNGVALPDGKVVVFGGQSYGHIFYDDNSILTPEIWDPNTGAWTQLAPESTPRNYHSIALLLRDGTVFSGGGGLCEEGTDCGDRNHPDGAIFKPPYLFQADGKTPAKRPKITRVSSKVIRLGTSVNLTLDKAAKNAAFSMVRLGTTTHTVNTDQRRVPLKFSRSGKGSTYKLQVPSDAGVALPGYYYLFALSSGIPSVAEIIQVIG